MSNDYWFFLSHARNDARDKLQRFYTDLAVDVRAKASLPSTLSPDDIGFKDDRAIETGTQWTQELATGIQSSRVLVCLFSNSYFKSPWCGREFRAFLDRIEAWQKFNKTSSWPPLIQPVLWDAPEKLEQTYPQIIKDLKLQAGNAALGQMYAEQGLEFILRLNEEKEYQKFLLAFRERVVDAATGNPLNGFGNSAPLDTIQSAFHPPLPTPSSAQAARILPDNVPLPSSFGPEVAWFVYVAGRDQDYASVRKQLDSYGAHGGPLWRPYLPPSEQTAGILTQSIVGKWVLRETLPLSTQLIEHLRNAEETNTIVLLIVDPWSVRVKDFQSRLADVDRENFVNCGVIVIWNEQDAETKATSNTLSGEISATFSRSIISKQLHLRPSVSSEAELEKELTAVIHEVQEKIKERLKLLRPVPGSSPAPLLDVPAGDSR